MKHVIALTGYVGSGKDTAAGMVEELFPNAVKVTFAKQLKEVLSMVFQIDKLYFYDRVLKEKSFEPIFLDPQMIDSVLRLYGIEAEYPDYRDFIGKIIYSPRELMEYVGTNILQKFDKQIHAKTEFRVAPKSDLYIVTDLRFIHEYEYLKENSETLQILYIANNIAELNAAIRKSIAEKQIPTIAQNALYVDNNGTFDLLRTNIEKYIKV